MNQRKGEQGMTTGWGRKSIIMSKYICKDGKQAQYGERSRSYVIKPRHGKIYTHTFNCSNIVKRKWPRHASKNDVGVEYTIRLIHSKLWCRYTNIAERENNWIWINGKLRRASHTFARMRMKSSNNPGKVGGDTTNLPFTSYVNWG